MVAFLEDVLMGTGSGRWKEGEHLAQAGAVAFLSPGEEHY